MKTDTMKFIDEKFGPLVCLCFHWYNCFKRIFSWSRYKFEAKDVRNILILKFLGMGSILLATPMMHALKEKFTNAKLTIFTFSNNKELCQNIDIIDEIVTVDPSNLLRFITSVIKGIVHIRRKHCEISIDLEFFAKSSTLIQYLCSTPVRVGFYLIRIGFLIKMMWRGNLLTHNVYYNPHKHTVDVFLALAKSIGASTADKDIEKVKASADDRTQVNALLGDMKIKDEDYIIAMNINAGQLCIERRWPLENFVQLTQRILEHSNVKIVLVGDREDTDYVNNFLSMMQNYEGLINLTGKLNIGMLVALLEKSQVFITNDSGPLHIAASLGTPTVSFFGPETPQRFGPLGDNHTVFYPNIYCSPCLNVFNQKIAPCNGNNECMRQILVEDVFRIIKQRYLK